LIKLKKLIEELLFERERNPSKIRLFGIATYIQTSSTRRTARILSELHSHFPYRIEMGKEA
jgi:hypothetical protein